MTIRLHRRYAIYFCPKPHSELARLGAQWLGWDPQSATAFAPLGGQWVEQARPYGLHATMKAPFRLEDPQSLPDLVERFAALCQGHTAFQIQLQLTRISQFWALVPTKPAAR